jgi:hemerythrin-like domain-containing protein
MMKRDRRLHGLSSDHHHALVLARALASRVEPWSAADGDALASRFLSELEPHFRIEEEVLLPALRATSAAELAERTLAEHEALRSALEAARAGDLAAARALGHALREHVRMEERELFPACEELLSHDVLDRVGRRAPR